MELKAFLGETQEGENQNRHLFNML